MVDQAILQLIYHGREERNLEYKGSLDWSAPATRAKITKASMAMANIPDGGAIVLGVGKDGAPAGMRSDHASSFEQDDVMDYVNGYASPYVELTVTPVQDTGKDFVVIQIQNFDRLPVVCTKPGLERLERGAMYTRSRRKYESAKVGTETEMREILERATDIQIHHLVARGLLSYGPGEEPTAEDRVRFEEQLGGL